MDNNKRIKKRKKEEVNNALVYPTNYSMILELDTCHIFPVSEQPNYVSNNEQHWANIPNDPA